MSDAPHLLIPLAASPSAGCQQALRDLSLPHLDRLLSRMTPAGMDSGEETDFSPPHERALARALGLACSAQGITPWAAWRLVEVGAKGSESTAWAYITPCQWHVSTDHVTMLDPAALRLTPDSSHELLTILAPWFAEDGIDLYMDENDPARWIARGDVFEGVATASLDRVIQRDVRAWMPLAENAEHTRRIHRLQTEMQMLLYTHPINDARAQANLPPVNTFWLHGAGRLTAPPPLPQVPPRMPLTLRDPALREDWRGWAEAWRALDAGPVAELEKHVASGGRALLTLCGENNAQQWQSVEPGWGRRIKRLFTKAPRLQALQKQL